MKDSYLGSLKIPSSTLRDITRQFKASGLLVPTETLPPLATGPPSDDIFAPRSFDDYIGQERAKDVCRIIVDAAKIENRPLPNMIIHGSYGKGKTSLARLCMERRGDPYRLVDGSTVAKLDYLSGHMIIDEGHNMPADVCDMLNTEMDAGKLHVIVATTNPGALPAAFRSRLRNISLEDYTEEDIVKILRNSLKRKKMRFTPNALEEIAARTRLNPRNAVQVLSFSLELATLEEDKSLKKETVRSALEKLDIDEQGLTGLDRRYLNTLSRVKPTGLTQICAVLGTNIETVEYEIEPFLLQQGLIERTPRGRLLVDPIDEVELLKLLERSVEISKSQIFHGKQLS